MANKFYKRIICILIALISAFSCTACKNNDEVKTTLFIKDGQTDYSIVVSQKATETELYAAEEFVNFTKEVTGAKLEVKTDDKISFTSAGKVISIGNTRLFKRSKIEVDSKSLNTDGFIIKNIDQMIFINGACDRGVLYGVYEFIERYYGVKFLTFDSTYIPNKPTVEIEEKLNIVEVPDFEVRDYYSGTTKNAVFAARMRMECYGAGDSSKMGGNFSDIFFDENFHNSRDYVEASPLYKNHPEWLYGSNYKGVCYTNGITKYGKLDKNMEESCVKAVIELLKEDILESKPTEKFFMIGQEDHAELCNCSRCVESVQRNGSRTANMIIWMNVICEEIKKWAEETVPEKDYKIACFAYEVTKSAPVKKDGQSGKYVPYNDLVVPHEDLYVMYCPITACYYHPLTDKSCLMNEATYEQLKGWIEITDRLFIWEYSCNYRNFLWYFPNLSVLKDNMQTYKDVGAVVIRNQGPAFDKNSYQQQLLTYLLSKLMWNVDRDVNALVEEFNKYYFEEGAEYMNEFIDLFESHFAILNMDTELYESNPKFLAAETYPLEFLNKAIELTEKGYETIEKSDKNDSEKEIFYKRFIRARIQPEYMLLRNIEAYAIGESAKREFIDNFFKNADWLGITSYGEGISANSVKEKYGY